ncbi:ABC transporter substrate-binding protein [Agarivorans sp. Alg241-V36]|uniref:ABC transporter substrate-binding protein n=1 Tax=Agarivorans sp. Alg241-V36 TaxID=2305992 RepID=UPI0013D5266B|nr:extracellular solute-binding protein [Agarivorans sp. Alg241-V36]
MKLFLSLIILMLSISSHANQRLVIDTWGDELRLWQQKIIPAFQRHHPEIELVIKQMDSWNYVPTQNQRFANQEAGDLVMCKPFDPSLNWFKAGYLEDITDLAGMENFPSFAQAAWQTDSGASSFCLPLGSVMHGFFYNKRAFAELGLVEPESEAEFFNILERIKSHGKYLPLAFGSKDAWAVSEVALQNIGPNYWQGEDGRFRLLEGKEAVDSPAYKQALASIQAWGSYMGEGHEARSYGDAWALFNSGKAVIAPGGSWEIANLSADLELAVFKPPVPEGQQQCYVSDHTDKGIAINSASPNKQAAYKLLQWMTSAEFAQLFTESEPGFFSLSNHFFELSNPLARTMQGWRFKCDVTIRNFSQLLSRGEPNFQAQMSEVSQAVIQQRLSPELAVAQLQQSLNQWYLPQQQLFEQHKLEQQHCTHPLVINKLEE